ncbi:LxmA leader domain family RiPP [Streptomyces sp. MST-110588]|nr:LxmA leader domain family RiPP [Streptomyces sp. MST-110588]UNO41781.1 LxmA leader domain family RiPP [Streptomyces sp. MST-110588]
MDAEQLFEGYTTYADAEELAAATQDVDGAPGSLVTVASVVVSIWQGC